LPVLRAGDVIRDSKPVYASPEDTVEEAARIMASHNVGSVPVVDEGGRLVGIFTERDLVRLVAKYGKSALDMRLGEVMTRNPVTASPDEPLPELAHKMIEHGFRHIPVVDSEGRLLGVVSIRRVLRHLMAGSEWP